LATTKTAADCDFLFGQIGKPIEKIGHLVENGHLEHFTGAASASFSLWVIVLGVFNRAFTCFLMFVKVREICQY
jgi:hypothetical protein